MEQQTAVEWLIEFIQDHCIRIDEKVIEQAKAMEKAQTEQAFNDGVKNSDDYVVIDGNVISAEQYYNETYNK